MHLYNVIVLSKEKEIEREKEKETKGIKESDEGTTTVMKPKYYRNFIQSGLAPHTLQSYDESY
jgi:hypothetical protein